jgi:hypothetical protein
MREKNIPERSFSPMRKSAISVSIRKCHVICFQQVDFAGLVFCVPINFFFAFLTASACVCVSCRRLEYAERVSVLAQLCD